jgi:hypothetical protein
LSPAIIADVESHLPSYTLYGDHLKDAAGNIVPEIKIVPQADGSWLAERTYEFDGNPEFTITMEKDEIKLLPDGGLDLPAWQYHNGTLTRETVIYPVPKTEKFEETDLPLQSIPEMIEILRHETQKIKDANGGVLPEKYTELSSKHATRLLNYYYTGVGGRHNFEYQGRYFRISLNPHGGNTWWENFIYIWDKTTSKYSKEPTIFYTWIAINKDGNYGWLALEDAGDKIQIYFIDKPYLNIESYMNIHAKYKGLDNPFRIDY